MGLLTYLDLHTRIGTCIDTRLRLTFAPDKIEKNASIKTSGSFNHIFCTTQKLKFSSYARELYEKRKNQIRNAISEKKRKVQKTKILHRRTMIWPMASTF